MNPRMNTIHQENYVGQHGDVNAGMTHYQDELQMNPRMNTIHQENYVGQRSDVNAGMTYYQDELQMNPRMNTIHQENYVGQRSDVNAGMTHYQDELQMNPRMNTIHQENYVGQKGYSNSGTTHLQDDVRVNLKMNTIHKEHYVGAHGIEPNHRLNTAEYNMELDDRKELAIKNRKPTTRKWDNIPTTETGIGQVNLKDPIYIDRAYHPKLSLDGTFRPIKTYQIKEDNYNFYNRIDNDILLQLLDNPLVNDTIIRHNDQSSNIDDLINDCD
jgi:hypothetical protein